MPPCHRQRAALVHRLQPGKLALHARLHPPCAQSAHPPPPRPPREPHSASFRRPPRPRSPSVPASGRSTRSPFAPRAPAPRMAFAPFSKSTPACAARPCHVDSPVARPFARRLAGQPLRRLQHITPRRTRAASRSVIGRETGLPTSSSLFSSSTISFPSKPASVNISSAVSAMATPAFMSSVPGPQQPPAAQPAGHRLQRSQRPNRIQMAEQKHPPRRASLRDFGPNRASSTSPNCALPVQLYPSAQRLGIEPQPAQRRRPLRLSHLKATPPPPVACVRSSSACSLRRAPASRARMGTAESGLDASGISLPTFLVSNPTGKGEDRV